VLVCAGLALLSVAGILAGGYDRFAWWGVLVASGVLPLFYAWLHFGNPARTTEYLPFLMLVSGAGPALVAWEVFEEGVAGWPLLVLAVLGSLLLVIYIFWYSRFSRRPGERLAVGGKMPAFELVDADGAIFRSAELDGSPAVLIFIRGNWCPVCMAQLREVAACRQELEDLGVTVLVISAQDVGDSRQLARRLAAPFRFLSDESNRLASSLGIAIRNGVPFGLPGRSMGDTVRPTVVALNSSGTIVYSDQTDNYRVRPEPDIYIAILRRAGAISR
jgi:peroxiredoxin